jgi:hypothetical protein
MLWPMAATKTKAPSKTSNVTIAEVDPAFEPIARVFLKHENVELKRMFSSHSVLALNGKIFAMLTGGKLVVKLPKGRVDALVETGDGTRFDPRKNGTPMKEWIAIPPGKQPWIALAKEAYAFADDPKKPQPRGSKK